MAIQIIDSTQQKLVTAQMFGDGLALAAVKFRDWWLEQRAKDPENYPEALTADGWAEQFDRWLGSQ